MAADGSVVIEILADDKDFQSKTSKLGNLASSALKGVTTVVAGATTVVAGLASAASKVGSGFEASMSQVAATMGITSDEIAAGSSEFEILTNAAKDAGATTAFSASEASSALNYLALAGYDAATAANALPAVLNLAAAGGLDLAYASDLATDAMAALGIEASQETLTKFGDEMAKTASKANTSVGQLGEAILVVGGTAKGLAGGTTELNAALGVLANRGIKGAEGGTALRNLILSLSAPTDKAAAAMSRMGLEVYDAAGNMRPLNEVFRDLDASMQGMSEGEKTQVLNEIFNKVDLKSAQAMLAGCGEEFDNLADAIANSGGAMQDMADTQLDNLQGDLTILKSGLEGLGISAYETMQGPLRESVKLATDMVGQIAGAFNKGGLTDAVGAVGNVLAQIVTKLASAAPTMINAGVQLLQSLVSGIQQNLPELATGAVDIVTSLVNGIIVLVPQLAEAAVQLLVALAEGIAAALPTLIPAAVEAVTTLITGLLENIPALVDAALQLIQGLAEGLIAAIPVLLEALPAIITSLVTALLESIPLIIQAGVDLLTALVGALPEIIATIVEVLPQIIDGIITTLLDNLPLIVQAGIDLLVALIQALPEIITTIVAALPEIISGIVDGLISNIPAIIMAGVQLFVALIENLPTIIVEIVKAVPQIIDGIVEAFGSLIGKIIEIGGDLLKGIWEGISGAAEWLWGKVKGFFSGLVDNVKGFLGIHSPSKVFAEIGSNTIEGYANGVDDGASDSEKRVLRTVEDLSEDMATGFEEGGSGSGAAMMENLTESAIRELPEIRKVAERAVESFTTGIKSKLKIVRQCAANIMDDVCTEITRYQKDFTQIGALSMAGFNEGLQSQAQKAISTARQTANAVVRERRRALDIHSPSRKMYKLVGEPAGEGFLRGFECVVSDFHRRALAIVESEAGRINKAIPPQMAYSGAAQSSADSNAAKMCTTIEVPVNLDGREIARSTAHYMGEQMEFEVM